MNHTIYVNNTNEEHLKTYPGSLGRLVNDLLLAHFQTWPAPKVRAGMPLADVIDYLPDEPTIPDDYVYDSNLGRVVDKTTGEYVPAKVKDGKIIELL